METVTVSEDLQSLTRVWRAAGERIALVPTMGNLHAGHYALIKEARRHAQRVVASVFVNPTQFGPGEDFERYPRSLYEDQTGLAAAGCDLLFAPTVEVLYPYGIERSVTIQVPYLTEVLEGASRPGHFDGVATVVSRLFHRVQPDCAVFGAKDYQQLRVIEHLVADMGWPLQVIGAPTVRAADGLALSSRNQYLNEAQRVLAPRLYRSLQQLPVALRQGRPAAEIEAELRAQLVDAGFQPDYLTLRRQCDLRPPAATEKKDLIVLAAARLGMTRLIDNLRFDLD